MIDALVTSPALTSILQVAERGVPHKPLSLGRPPVQRIPADRADGFAVRARTQPRPAARVRWTVYEMTVRVVYSHASAADPKKDQRATCIAPRPLLRSRRRSQMERTVERLFAATAADRRGWRRAERMPDERQRRRHSAKCLRCHAQGMGGTSRWRIGMPSAWIGAASRSSSAQPTSARRCSRTSRQDSDRGETRSPSASTCWR